MASGRGKEDDTFRPTILVIDHDRQTRFTLHRELRRGGFLTLTADVARAGLVLARRTQPHAIVMDLAFPDLDGLELCRRLKRAPETEHIPVLILTARNDVCDIVAALEIGAGDYMTKPFSAAVLAARLRVLLRPRWPEIGPAGPSPSSLTDAGHASQPSH